MVTLPEAERAAWSSWLNCEPSDFDRCGLLLLPNPKSDAKPQVVVLSTFTNTIISLPASAFTYFEAKLRPLADSHLITITDIINSLKDDTIKVGYILAQGSIEGEYFNPRSRPEVCLLPKDQLEALQSLEQGCHPVEWQHSCLSYISENTHAYVVDNQAIAAAHYLKWPF